MSSPRNTVAVHGLVGRDAELASLRGAIEDIEDSGASIVVRGPAGIGKSSLLRAAAVFARERHALVLEFSGIESEAMAPLAGLHQLLRPIMSRAAALPPVQRRALAAAFGAAQGPPPEPFLTALAAMSLVVDAAAARPVVVVVDDVQWLDSDTIGVLAFVSRRLRHDRVVMISGLRDGHGSLMSSADAIEIVLQGLDAASSRTLLARVDDDLSDAEQQALLEQAQGNPLAIVEMPTAWRSVGIDVLAQASAAVPLTSRLEQAFAARIAELPSATRDALLIAAVVAADSLADVLAGTAELSGREATTLVLEPAVQLQLLGFDDVHVRFRHPLVRAAVLSAEPRRRRQAANAAVSRILVADEQRRVWHEAQAVDGPDDDVADRLVCSAADHVRRGAVLQAIAALERSAELTRAPRGRAGRLLLAAHHAFGLGRTDLLGRLVEAAERTPLCEADRARVEWLRELFGDGELGNPERVRELCTLADRSASVGETDLALHLLASAAQRCWWAADNPADGALVVRCARDLTALQDDPRCIAVTAVADPLGQAARTRRRLEAKVAVGVSDAESLRQLATAARAVGAEVLAADFFESAESKLREQGQLGLLSQLLPIKAAVHLDLGDWSRASESLEEGRRLAQDTGQALWSTGAAAVAAVLEGLTGRTELALRHADDVEAACAGDAAGDFLCLAQIARGAAYLSARRDAEAFAVLATVFDPTTRYHHPREQLGALMCLVEAAQGCGRVAEAREIMVRMEQLCRVTASPILQVHLLYARPVLAADADAGRLFREGLAHDLTRWPWPRARIELAYGQWLRRQRCLVDARAPLRAAAATFGTLDAQVWAAQARGALRAAGERLPAADAPAGPHQLTAQEVQIARLAADGLSNRQIGEQLYLSPRTIGSYLYRIFPKLGVTSRSQMAECMKI